MLFPDYKADEQTYYAKTGIFPIMHVLGLKKELVEAHPWIVPNLYQAFEDSKAIAMRRMRNPRLVPLAWYQDAWEEQGAYSWNGPVGIRSWRSQQKEFGYAGWLLARSGADRIPLDELFLSVSQGRKRGKSSV